MKPATEIKVTLHTDNGPVVTSYPNRMEADVIRLIALYVEARKSFTISYE